MEMDRNLVKKQYVRLIETSGFKVQLAQSSDDLGENPLLALVDLRVVATRQDPQTGQPLYFFFMAMQYSDFSFEKFEKERSAGDLSDFTRAIQARFVPYSKEDLIRVLLDGNGLKIEDIYADGNIKLNLNTINILFDALNFKGGK